MTSDIPSSRPHDTHASASDVSPDVAECLHTLGLPIREIDAALENMTPIAIGGCGEIYSGFDPVLKRTVALKRLKTDIKDNLREIERLTDEAIASAQLEHPSIIPIHSIGVSPEKGVYFTMKRLTGDSLRHIISELAQQNPGYVKAYSLTARLGIFIKICQGISYAHSKQLIHRDLKPENIIVGNFGEVTIIDWGLVKQISKDYRPVTPAPDDERPVWETADESTRLNFVNKTIIGQISGTPRFMSPEQFDGDPAAIDACTDIYALGVILYELLTCTNPFAHLTEQDTIHTAVARAQYLKPHDTFFGKHIPPELEAICLKAMHVNKEHRYQSVKTLIADLHAYLDGRPVPAYRAPLSFRFLKCCRRNPIKTAVLLSSVCSIVFFVLSVTLFTSLSVKDTIRNTVHDFRFAALKLRTLEQNTPRNPRLMSTRQDQALLNSLNEIDNLIVSANIYLSSLPSRYIDDPDIRQHRESVMLDRIRFAINRSNLSDLRKVRGAITAQFGQDPEVVSRELRAYIRYLDAAIEGRCNISIYTDEPGTVSFTLSPLTEDPETGRLTPGHPLELLRNTLPAEGLVIPKGSYRLTCSAPGKPDTVSMLTLGHGEYALLHVRFPKRTFPGTVFIPEAKTTLFQNSAGEPETACPPAWHPFFIAQHEVTLDEYRKFWDALKDPELKTRFRPLIQTAHGNAAILSPWDDRGTPNQTRRNGRPLFRGDMPVTGITQQAAQAFCRWKSEQLHAPCRLPTADEWLRAATGDTDRGYPWGTRFIPNAARLKNTADAGLSLFAPVGSFPDDCSPYGLYDTAGNAREWTATPCDDNVPDEFTVLGASASVTPHFLPLRKPSFLEAIPSDIGFRYLVECPEPALPAAATTPDNDDQP